MSQFDKSRQDRVADFLRGRADRSIGRAPSPITERVDGQKVGGPSAVAPSPSQSAVNDAMFPERRKSDAEPRDAASARESLVSSGALALADAMMFGKDRERVARGLTRAQFEHASNVVREHWDTLTADEQDAFLDNYHAMSPLVPGQR
ncbi:MAG TPA: hypothetical protein VJN96_04225 [Vicinamibacterales bacterium]|nr:hypothetical protein [Vicinamibacterales bacterium]